MVIIFDASKTCVNNFNIGNFLLCEHQRLSCAKYLISFSQILIYKGNPLNIEVHVGSSVPHELCKNRQLVMFSQVSTGGGGGEGVGMPDPRSLLEGVASSSEGRYTLWC